MNKKLGRNYMAKIPVIKGGIEAIEACFEENIPVCATEVFSISQAISICEICEKVAKHKGKAPVLYITHISGIFDEYLGKVAKRENIQIDSEILKQAGVTIARKEYELLQTYGGKAVLLGGGARGPHHFTELVGGNVHVTINWSTAQEIMDSNILINSRIDAKTDLCVIDELCEKFIDFKKAYDADGLEIPDFASFGPVQLFRNTFLKGWYLLLAKITERRSFMALS
jgi:transaldolase